MGTNQSGGKKIQHTGDQQIYQHVQIVALIAKTKPEVPTMT